MRRWLIAVSLLLVAAACGGSLTLTEYAEQVESLVVALNAEMESLDTERDSRGPSVEGEIDYWESRVAARQRFRDGISALDPPAEVADLHNTAVDVMVRLTAAEEAVAAQAQNLQDLTGIAVLWASAEVAVWKAVDEESQTICLVAQRELDRTAERAELEGVAWIPPEMKETVRVAFGCPEAHGGG